MTLALAAIALAAFATEGALGFGATVIAASLGGQLVDVAVLVPAFVPVNIALSSWLVARGADRIAWRLLLELAPPIALGAAIGLAAFHPGPALAIALGVFVAALAALELARPAARPLPALARRALLVAAGIAHGLFGTGGPLVVYVARRRLADPRAFRATLAVLWLALNVALVVRFACAGLYTRDSLQLLAIVAAALIPGLALGERLHARLDPARFARLVWLLLLAAGVALALRAALT
jgi:uncharacterized membrane protein YfcA